MVVDDVEAAFAEDEDDAKCLANPCLALSGGLFGDEFVVCGQDVAEKSC